MFVLNGGVRFNGSYSTISYFHSHSLPADAKPEFHFQNIHSMEYSIYHLSSIVSREDHLAHVNGAGGAYFNVHAAWTVVSDTVLYQRPALII